MQLSFAEKTKYGGHHVFITLPYFLRCKNAGESLGLACEGGNSIFLYISIGVYSNRGGSKSYLTGFLINIGFVTAQIGFAVFVANILGNNRHINQGLSHFCRSIGVIIRKTYAITIGFIEITYAVSKQDVIFVFRNVNGFTGEINVYFLQQPVTSFLGATRWV